MSRLHFLHHRAMSRNITALLLAAASYEQPRGANAWKARDAAPIEDREAQFDIEGIPCWRDPFAGRPA